jgi:hypothetical protein
MHIDIVLNTCYSLNVREDLLVLELLVHHHDSSEFKLLQPILKFVESFLPSSNVKSHIFLSSKDLQSILLDRVEFFNHLFSMMNGLANLHNAVLSINYLNLIVLSKFNDVSSELLSLIITFLFLIPFNSNHSRHVLNGSLKASNPFCILCRVDVEDF